MNENVHSMSLKKYNVCIGAFILYALLINVFSCNLFYPIVERMNIALYLFAYVVLCIISIILIKSDKIALSIIGFTAMSLICGSALSVLVHETDKLNILHAIVITASTVIVMIALAMIFPNVFLSMGKVLFICLGSTLIIDGIFILLGLYNFKIWDLLVAILFALYIGHDWADSQKKERNMRNAIGSATSLYLDIINIFARSTSFGSKK